MAIFCRGMTGAETASLTRAMIRSGRVLDFSDLPVTAVDKHSTGGVGDKTSLILAPIAAAAGVPVPMISGRGLGHTGGTLDKLEAIPGFRVGLALDEFAAAVRRRGLAMIGQTGEICPADKRMYALRDVTATVESLPLICASIMSKKLAEGAGALVLDVKYGSGAFMKTAEAAAELANGLIAIGAAHGKRISAYLTRADEPLGRFVGNALEIGEALAVLRQGSYLGRPAADFADTRDLSLRLAGEMIWLARLQPTPDDGYREAERVLASGRAAEKWEELCAAQGGNLAELPVAAEKQEVLAGASGYISAFNCEKLGLAAIALGGGRLKASDQIEPAAGIEFHCKLGSRVERGEPICRLYAQDRARFAQAVELVAGATTISLQKPPPVSLITARKVG
jgi:pyrimidine-nucleoside phosphorylase